LIRRTHRAYQHLDGHLCLHTLSERYRTSVIVKQKRYGPSMSQDLPTAVLKIGVLAKVTGVSVRSIRHYDQHGLLASTRTENGYRAFQTVAITQVKQIQRLIASGFNLEEMRSFPDCMLLIEGASACSNITDVQRKRLAILEKQIEVLEGQRQRLRSMLTESAAFASPQD